MNGSNLTKNGARDHSPGDHSIAMEASGCKVFNDSVHGHIALHPLLVAVVDTPQFQRLRNIKQLGLAYYVYPGAGHCRFEHSLGTCYLAGEMVRKLLSKSRCERSALEVDRLTLCVQLAGLCHDIGHGPFSHTWEAITDRWGYSWKHEESSVQMFDYLVQVNNLQKKFKSYGLGEEERNIVKQLILGGPAEGETPLLKPQDHFLYEIVSNRETGIDVDKWDYFLRDGLHLNLRITFEYRRLLEFCTVLPSDGGPDVPTHLAFRDKEMMNLYDMYRVRSTLHHTAYRHRVVTNIELMFVDAFVAAGEANYKINGSEISLREAHKSPAGMSQLTDHLFYDLLYSTDPALETSRALLQRVTKRDLYEFVGSLHLAMPAEGRKAYIKEQEGRLDKVLKASWPELEFRVTHFFLDLDAQNDPVSRVRFYQMMRPSKKIVQQSYSNIKDLLEPFPFHLTNESTAQLFVFCATKNVSEELLQGAKDVVSSYSHQ